MAKPEDDDNIATLNRFNITFARSSRVLQGWVSQKSATPYENQDEFVDDEDFKSENASAGIASKAAYAEDDALLDGAIQRQRLASNDALAKLVLGQQGANARKKSQAPGKAMSSNKHAAPKPITTRPKVSRETNSDDEGEGRAAAFKSKQQRTAPKAPVEDVKSDDEPMDYQVDDERSTSKQPSAATSDANEEPKPTKRKTTSYLDELLAQRAKKKSKKKKKIQTELTT